MYELHPKLETADVDDPAAREFLTRYTAAWARPTAERLAGFWVADGELRQAGMAAPVQGRAAIQAFQDGVLTALPDLRVRPLAAARNGDTLLVHYRCETMVSGQALVFEGFDRFELDGALARRGTCIFDTALLKDASTRRRPEQSG